MLDSRTNPFVPHPRTGLEDANVGVRSEPRISPGRLAVTSGEIAVDVVRGATRRGPDGTLARSRSSLFGGCQLHGTCRRKLLSPANLLFAICERTEYIWLGADVASDVASCAACYGLRRRSVPVKRRRSVMRARRSGQCRSSGVTGHSRLQRLQHHVRITECPWIVLSPRTMPAAPHRAHPGGTRK